MSVPFIFFTRTTKKKLLLIHNVKHKINSLEKLGLSWPNGFSGTNRVISKGAFGSRIGQNKTDKIRHNNYSTFGKIELNR